jgi:phosphoesterase RecJ-like protein
MEDQGRPELLHLKGLMEAKTRDLNTVAEIVKTGKSFFLGSHKDPDGDALGSVLALGEALSLSGKQVMLFNEGPINDSLAWLPGIEKVAHTLDPGARFDAVFLLDCATYERLGSSPPDLHGSGTLINIDHHENNTRFGDLNIVEPGSSSTGELIYRLIRAADLPMNKRIAENIFVAIQTDTGSFRYDNTTKAAFVIAGEMCDWGIDPWRISRRVMDGYTVGKLQLLAAALKSIEVYYGGKLGLLTITSGMCSAWGADITELDRFVDFPRFIAGVEMAALIRECKHGCYRFSLRSNDSVNVADLAALFGGGGHPRAAAFTREGCLDSVKREFLSRALVFLDHVSDNRESGSGNP